MVASRNLRRGQLTCVDSHIGRFHEEDCIFVAFWSSTPLSHNHPQISLKYHVVQMNDENLHALYDEACRFCSSLFATQLVSVTFTGCKNQNLVCGIFYYAEPSSAQADKETDHLLQLKWTANMSSMKLAKGAVGFAGQVQDVAVGARVVAIDTHSMYPYDMICHVAFYEEGRLCHPGRLAFSHQYRQYPWDAFYCVAKREAYFMPRRPLSITSCADTENGATFVWYYEDKLTVSKPLPALVDQLKVMSWHIWRDGGYSLPLTSEIIMSYEPDIVALQHCSLEAANLLAKRCGLYCTGIPGRGYPVLSRWPAQSCIQFASGGAYTIQPPNSASLYFFNVNLAHSQYLPFSLTANGKSVAEALRAERETQLASLEPILDAIEPLRTRKQMVLLAGNFNTASHLDCVSGPAWPCSVACESVGLSDTYREAHTRSVLFQPCDRRTFFVEQVGCLQKPEEFDERVDRMYFSRDSGLAVTATGHLDASNSRVDFWPSTHRAVLTHFNLRHIS
eukprot:TRINITY_DN42887_c0_g1_i1.p1 TRINITY_DN42887_c0_g1~~TRINITY_DN42887_c0_g1_i1.p1  ORF type:complete len:568 (-),score=50.22 TRINITY_DN42887_c0_g1_i1:66-1583(-)